MKNNIVLGVTGSIACYKACEIANLLAKSGFLVSVVMTKEALEFITPLTFRHITKNPVITDMFNTPDEFSPVHTSLADRADLILIAPATANIIGKIASGICDDILSATVVSSEAPIIFAPAMNEKMYENKIVQENIRKLKSLGYKFVGPIKGALACGHTGIGHIAKIEEIVDEVKKALLDTKTQNLKRRT